MITLVIVLPVIFLGIGFVSGYLVRRHAGLVVHVDADVQLLDDVLKLDAALYRELDWLTHKDKSSPHVGIWVYRDEDGRAHVSSRHTAGTGDDNRCAGESFATALLALWSTLNTRAEERKRVLEEAGVRGRPS